MKRLFIILVFIGFYISTYSQSNMDGFIKTFKTLTSDEGWVYVYEGFEDVNYSWGHGSGEITINAYQQYSIIFLVENCPNHDPFIKFRVDGEEVALDYQTERDGNLVFAIANIYETKSITGQFVGRIGSDSFYKTYMLLMTK